jgi:hypothetical protein
MIYENVFLLYCFTEKPPEQLKEYLEYGLKLSVHKGIFLLIGKPGIQLKNVNLLKS